MPPDITPPVHATPIKWTEEEWDKIAVQLCYLKGEGVLESDGGTEIKARDVFEAQNILPAERRRKQISIAQGFQAIRTRLRDLYKRGQQINLFTAAASGSMSAASQDTTTPVVMTAANSASKESHSFQTAKPDLSSESDLASNGSSDNVQRSHTPKEDTAADVHGGQVADVVPTTGELEQGLHEGSQLVLMAITSPASVPRSTRSGPLLEGSGGHAKQTEQPGVSLTELARPFVAMVCEELVRALGQTFSDQGIFSTISARSQPDRVGAMRPTNELSPRFAKFRQTNDLGPGMRDDDRDAKRPQGAELQEDEVGQPMDVQPLFDPKLPPSANSDFKPMIGLVATRTHEYEDLPMLYPQLQFSIVPAEGIRGPEAFRDCQRIIGAREEVPQATDDMLKRTLRYRYIRLSGGAASVREQLDAWLAKPTAMQNGPRAPAQHNEKQGRNGSVKKRGKWPPRVA